MWLSGVTPHRCFNSHFSLTEKNTLFRLRMSRGQLGCFISSSSCCSQVWLLVFQGNSDKFDSTETNGIRLVSLRNQRRRRDCHWAFVLLAHAVTRASLKDVAWLCKTRRYVRDRQSSPLKAGSAGCIISRSSIMAYEMVKGSCRSTGIW